MGQPSVIPYNHHSSWGVCPECAVCLTPMENPEPSVCIHWHTFAFSLSFAQKCSSSEFHMVHVGGLQMQGLWWRARYFQGNCSRSCVTCDIGWWALGKRITMSLNKPRLYWLLSGVPLLWNSGVHWLLPHGLKLCRLFCLELFLWVRYNVFLILLMLPSLSGWSDKHL